MWASATINSANAEAPPIPGLNPNERHYTLDQLVDLRIERSESLEQLTRVLYWLLLGGHSVGPNGQLLFARALVDRLGRLEIVIQLTEHAPPHFHVKAPNVNASFRIEDCSYMVGEINGRDRDLVQRWYRTGRPKLIQKWNSTRPSNCPVGPIGL